jgi:hypothetical protein
MLVFQIQKHEGLDKSIVYLASFANLKGHLKIEETVDSENDSHKAKKLLFSGHILSNELLPISQYFTLPS